MSFYIKIDLLDKYTFTVLQCFRMYIELKNRYCILNLIKCIFLFVVQLELQNKNLIFPNKNKNIWIYMDQKIYQCNSSKKTGSKKSTPAFVKCLTTSTMYSNAKPIVTAVPNHTSTNGTVSTSSQIGVSSASSASSISIQASVHKKKKLLPKNLVKQNVSKSCIY